MRSRHLVALVICTGHDNELPRDIAKREGIGVEFASLLGSVANGRFDIGSSTARDAFGGKLPGAEVVRLYPVGAKETASAFAVRRDDTELIDKLN